MRMASEWRIKERLGVPRKLPPTLELTSRINVADENDKALYAVVTIHPRTPGHVHRTEVTCPACGHKMSMGRLNQHYPCGKARG